MLAHVAVVAIAAGEDFAVIGLGLAGERGQQVVLDLADVEFDQLPAAAGSDQAAMRSLARRTSCRASKLKSSAVASTQVSGRPVARSNRLSAAISER